MVGQSSGSGFDISRVVGNALRGKQTGMQIRLVLDEIGEPLRFGEVKVNADFHGIQGLFNGRQDCLRARSEHVNVNGLGKGDIERPAGTWLAA